MFLVIQFKRGNSTEIDRFIGIFQSINGTIEAYRSHSPLSEAEAKDFQQRMLDAFMEAREKEFIRFRKNGLYAVAHIINRLDIECLPGQSGPVVNGVAPASFLLLRYKLNSTEVEQFLNSFESLDGLTASYRKHSKLTTDEETNFLERMRKTLLRVQEPATCVRIHEMGIYAVTYINYYPNGMWISDKEAMARSSAKTQNPNT